jgi:hypothetical protein
MHVRDILLLIHFMGLVMGAGSGFALFVIGFLSKQFPESTRAEILVKLFPLRYISYLGLLLLLVSGIPLLIPYGAAIHLMPLVMVKLTAVLIIVSLSIYGTLQMQLAKKGNLGVYLKRLKLVGQLSFLFSLIAIICAVYSFH